MNSNVAKYILVYLCLTAGLLLVYSPAYLNKFVQHDNVYHYIQTDDREKKNDCLHAPQFLYIHSIGRPIAARLECEVYKHIYSAADHQKIRIFIIAIMGFVGLLMFILFKRYGIGDELAFTLPFVFLLFPGSQHTVMMTSVNNVIAYGVSVLGVMTLPLDARGFGKRFWFRLALSLFALLYCVYSYQSTAFFPFVLLFLITMFSHRSLPPLRMIILPFGLFISAGLIYQKFSLLFIVPQAAHMATNMYPMPSISDMIHSLYHFHFSPLLMAFNFWFVTPNTEIAQWAYGLTAVLLLVILVRFKSERLKMLLGFLLFYFTAGSVVLAPGWTPRVLQPVMLTAIGFVLYVTLTLIDKLKIKRAVSLKKAACFVTIFLAAFLANANVLTNVTNQVVEGSFFRTALASHGKNLSHIHVVIPKPGDAFMRDMFGLGRLGDSDHMYNIEQHQGTFHMIRYHVEEMDRFKYLLQECLFKSRVECQSEPRFEKVRNDPRMVWVTQSYVGDDFCVYPDTLVINTFDYLVSWNAIHYMSREIKTPPFDENLIELTLKNRKSCKIDFQVR